MPRTPEERAAYMRTWNAANADKIRQQRHARHAANPEKNRSAAKKRYAKNPEPIKARNRASHHKNIDERNAYSREYSTTHREDGNRRWHEWRSRNIEKERERVRLAQRARAAEAAVSLRAWRKANPDKARLQVEKRRAHKLNAPLNDLTPEQWTIIQDAYNHRCAYCDKRARGRLTQDHITPLSKGGSHTMHNVVPACQSCNSKKNAGPLPSPVQPLLL